MSGAPRTRARYEKILDAAREAGPNATAIARLASCDKQTAKRLLDKGWPGIPWARPIREVLKEEGTEARVRAAARLKVEVEGIAQDAARKREQSVETLTAERQLVTVGRNAVVEMARAALNHRDLLGALLDRVRIEAPTLAVKNLAPLLRELRQLLAEVPRLAIALAEEGREARAEVGGGVMGVGPDDDGRPEEDLIHDLVGAVDALASHLDGGGALTPEAVNAAGRLARSARIITDDGSEYARGNGIAGPPTASPALLAAALDLPEREPAPVEVVVESADYRAAQPLPPAPRVVRATETVTVTTRKREVMLESGRRVWVEVK